MSKRAHGLNKREEVECEGFTRREKGIKKQKEKKMEEKKKDKKDKRRRKGRGKKNRDDKEQKLRVRGIPRNVR